MGLLDLFTGSNVKSAYDQAGAKLGAAGTAYNQFAGQAADTLSTNYMKALEQWAPFLGGGTTALPAYLAGMGLNGPEGRDAAVSSYIQGPGVQNAITNAVNASNRAFNALGGQTGNAAAAASKIATDISLNDYYKNYMGGLLPLLNMGQGAAGSAANLYSGLGGGLANLLTGQGKVGLDIAGQLGQFDVNKAGAENAAAANIMKLGLAGLTAGTGGGSSLLGGLGGSLFQGMTGKQGLLGSGSNWYV